MDSGNAPVALGSKGMSTQPQRNYTMSCAYLVIGGAPSDNRQYEERKTVVFSAISCVQARNSYAVFGEQACHLPVARMAQ